MRITCIEISRFKAFYDNYRIDLSRKGKNLLVYGENGSGKSSLHQALNLILASSSESIRFADHRNIFAPGTDGSVKLHLRSAPTSPVITYEWSSTRSEASGDSMMLAANKTKAFLDYKSLLETHFLHRSDSYVNIFDLLVHNLLANTINDATGNTFADDWSDIQAKIPARNTEITVALVEDAVENFNVGLASKLLSLRTKASEILVRFGYQVALQDFDFNGISYNRASRREDKNIDRQEILLNVQFFGSRLNSHHRFLNEAKLSAIAVSIYLAAQTLLPPSALQILCLDDILIGLDMSNRLPIVDILRDEFSGYQIILTTFDRIWFEMLRFRTTDAEWAYAELFSSDTDNYELPLLKTNQRYLDKARVHFINRDYKAAIVYLRTAFEAMLKKFCERMNLSVRYRSNQNRLTSEDFWLPIKRSTHLVSSTVADIELYRRFILNPLSHAGAPTVIPGEVNDAILAVENLHCELSAVR